jgi:hypothetical protein
MGLVAGRDRHWASRCEREQTGRNGSWESDEARDEQLGSFFDVEPVRAAPGAILTRPCASPEQVRDVFRLAAEKSPGGSRALVCVRAVPKPMSSAERPGMPPAQNKPAASWLAVRWVRRSACVTLKKTVTSLSLCGWPFASVLAVPMPANGRMAIKRTSSALEVLYQRPTR